MTEKFDIGKELDKIYNQYVFCNHHQIRFNELNDWSNFAKSMTSALVCENCKALIEKSKNDESIDIKELLTKLRDSYFDAIINKKYVN